MTRESVRMRDIRKALALCIAAAVVAVPTVSAAVSATRLTASMNARHVVTPKNKRWVPPKAVANARGTFFATLGGANGRTLRWRITYTGVGASPLQIADVHYGAPGKFGPILFRLCGPCRSGQTGTKKITPAAVRTLKSGQAWVTVITGKYPNGVIRGQIKAS